MTKRIVRVACLGFLMTLLAFPLTLSARDPHSRPPQTPHRPYETMRGTVEVFTPRAITLRDLKQIYLIRTFSYDPKLLPKMQRRHYVKGDRVTVKYFRGSDIAVKVK